MNDTSRPKTTPRGWVLVPICATPAMIDAAVEDEREWRRMPEPEARMELHWSAMVRAAMLEKEP